MKIYEALSKYSNDDLAIQIYLQENGEVILLASLWDIIGIEHEEMTFHHFEVRGKFETIFVDSDYDIYEDELVEFFGFDYTEEGIYDFYSVRSHIVCKEIYADVTQITEKEFKKREKELSKKRPLQVVWHKTC